MVLAESLRFSLDLAKYTAGTIKTYVILSVVNAQRVCNFWTRGYLLQLKVSVYFGRNCSICDEKQH